MQWLCHLSCKGWTTYCNSCSWGILTNQLLRQQWVQATAARIVTQPKRSDHITPILHDLHWLPVEMLHDYKIMSPVYSCMNGKAPQYLWELISNGPLPSCALSPILHPISSSYPQHQPKKTRKNTFKSEYFPMLHPNYGTVCPVRNSIIWRKLLGKTWRPTCFQIIRFAQTVHQWLFAF